MPAAIARRSCAVAFLFRCAELWFTSRSESVEGAGMIDVINRILEEGRDNDDLGAILEKVSEQLVAWGIPVRRATLNMPTIDPAAGVLSFQWSRTGDLIRLSMVFESCSHTRI